MPLEPALGELAVDTCPVFVGIAAGLQERRIDQLDIDAAVLHRLNCACDLNQLTCGDIRIGEGAGLDEFHASCAYLLSRMIGP
jgi:hypothetical protein